jgi:hypothetical protein
MRDNASTNIAVDEFEVADPANARVQAGFSVDSDAVCRVGEVTIEVVGSPETASEGPATLRDS